MVKFRTSGQLTLLKQIIRSILKILQYLKFNRIFEVTKYKTQFRGTHSMESNYTKMPPRGSKDPAALKTKGQILLSKFVYQTKSGFKKSDF